MTKLERAKLLDKLLLKFTGGITISWDELLNDSRIKNELHLERDELKRLLDFLITGNYLEIRGRIPYNTLKTFESSINPTDTLSLGAKGHQTISDIQNLGFEAKELNSIKKENIEIETLKYAKYAFWATLISIIVSLIAIIIK